MSDDARTLPGNSEPGDQEKSGREDPPDDQAQPGADDREETILRWLKEHEDVMRATARRVLGSAPAEEDIDPAAGAVTPADIVQLASVAALGSRKPIAEIGSPGGWLLGIVRNVAWKHVEKEKRREELRHQHKVDLEAVFGGGDDFVPEDPRMPDLRAAVERLPASQKKVALLMLKGLEDDQIAAELEVKEGTVRVYRSRAVEALCKLLGVEPPDKGKKKGR